ncbi:MAG: DUF58 domain-containing protein [Chloroflexi bacterium]|nr:DUF58 domain-containing protein [Chloroflexota bacterium]
MLLTRQSLLLLLLTAPFLALGTLARELLILAVVYLLLVMIMIVTDYLLSPAPKDFETQRVNDTRLSLGADNLIIVRVTHRGRRATRLIARDEFPPQFAADHFTLGERETVDALARHSPFVIRNLPFAPLRPRETVEFRYHVRPPRRGDYRFGDTNLRWRGVLGMIVRQARYATGAPVKVYPNLLDIRKYQVLARRHHLTEMGLRQTRVLGRGAEFERLREYQPDDEFRRIDWKATARRSKPISREFETERSQTILALLDVGRMMRAPVENLAKLDYAVNAVLMLSYVAGLRGDKVGLIAFADEVTHFLTPRSGKGQFYRMLATLYGVESQPVESDYARAFAFLGAKHKKRSLVVVFTDLSSGLAVDTIVAQMASLRPRHLPLLVAISDPSVHDLARQRPRDSQSVYERVVAEQLLDERALLLESLRHRGVLTLDVPANQLTIAVVNRYLESKAVGRI